MKTSATAPEAKDGFGQIPDSVLQLIELLAERTSDLRKKNKGFDESGKEVICDSIRNVVAGLLSGQHETNREGTNPTTTGSNAAAGSVNNPDIDIEASVALWKARQGSHRAHRIKDVRALAVKFLKLGQPLVAYDVLQEGLQRWPDDARLRQLIALALLRSGWPDRAFAILQQLQTEGIHDEETLGMLARIHKDRALHSVDIRKKRKQLQLAYSFYSKAYEKTGGYWTGVNAATIAAVLNKKEHSEILAGSVKKRCRALLERASNARDRFWLTASLAECALILGAWAEAEDYYSKAGEIGRGWFGDISSTLRNARLLLNHFRTDRVKIDQCLSLPRVAVFSGHMIDAGRRFPPRFPEEVAPLVAEEIERDLKQADCRIGFASAACGSDILFLETILKLGGEAHIVLPCDRELFARTSVEIVPGSKWLLRFEAVLQKAADVLTVSSHKTASGGILYEYANLMLYGLAAIRAEQLETELVPIAVWDGKPGDGPGGTAQSVELWRRLGHTVRIVDIGKMMAKNLPTPGNHGKPKRIRRIPLPGPKKAKESDMRIAAVLFADVVQYTRITDEAIPHFVDGFLGMVSEIEANSPFKPEVKNTWGDGLFFAFTTVQAAGLFALDLSDKVIGANWKQKRLPADFNIRIALHAGPVYRCLDPVTGKFTYMGMHVSRAARIEPITPPGKVYASHAFAALSRVENIREFKCEYVGQTPLAKGYGTFPTFHVRRCTE